ncbi:unnamed protein product [Amoebophrya sp. A25]|nr:unnamed protein product [Amoebophrya sp. A25]|eukprot:GSA25T00017007001.1
MADATAPCVVIGGGLAGMAAASTILENGGKVVLLEKCSSCGGNSVKAASGINIVNTQAQKDQGIEDSVEQFISDCVAGGAPRNYSSTDKLKILAENSVPDCDWLKKVFSVDLFSAKVARLGGHSVPRTHRNAPTATGESQQLPGLAITSALIKMVEKIAQESKGEKAKIITNAKATELIFENEEKVTGVKYEKDGETVKQMGAVIIATGGFGADFSSTTGCLLEKYRPDLLFDPTSNGEFATGDGIKMALEIGARTGDLHQVQCHPLGLINPKDPDAKEKMVAAEALCGAGALIFDNGGKRFVNELGPRNYMTKTMQMNYETPLRLLINKAASEEMEFYCKYYTASGHMKFYENGAALAKEWGVPVETLAEVHEAHYQAAKKQEEDPEGGEFPAYPDGQSWDKPSGSWGVGDNAKKFYANVIPGEKFAEEPFYVATITPEVIHYCLGGLECTTNAEVGGNIKGEKVPIPGLYAAGQVMGGIHGKNRLGGNALLDSLVFGRIAGKACAKYTLGEENLRETDLKVLSGAIPKTANATGETKTAVPRKAGCCPKRAA